MDGVKPDGAGTLDWVNWGWLVAAAVPVFVIRVSAAGIPGAVTTTPKTGWPLLSPRARVDGTKWPPALRVIAGLRWLQVPGTGWKAMERVEALSSKKATRPPERDLVTTIRAIVFCPFEQPVRLSLTRA